jgi:metal-responsive CopG/Arc/MetJ family transcriptional regulator
MPNKRSEQKRIVGLWLNEAVVSQVDAIAKEQDRDRSYVIRQAVIEYVIKSRQSASLCAPSVPYMEHDKVSA